MRLLLMATILILNSCGLGKQEPLWQSGMFSADGKYYAYTYSETTITGIQKKGTATSRQGIITNYLQIIDLSTGEKILKKPYKSKGMLWLREIEDSYIWLQNLNISDGISTPVLFDIASHKMKYTAEDLQKINPEIFAKSTSTFYKETAAGLVSVEAADGRKYHIDPTSGKASIATGNFQRVQDKNFYCYQTENSIKGIANFGDTRKKLTKKENGNTLNSQDDFINPKFLAIDKASLTSKSIATFYGDYFFVISDHSTTDKKDRQLSMLNQNTLQSQWSIAIPQATQEMNNYDKERFFLYNNLLYVSNSTNLIIIDADKGKVTQTIALFTEK